MTQKVNLMLKFASAGVLVVSLFVGRTGFVEVSGELRDVKGSRVGRVSLVCADPFVL